MKGPDFREIRDGLELRIEELAAKLAPDGRRNGNYWIARNPTRDDKHAGSFWIRLRKPAVGAWKDEATGAGGDVVQLIAYVNGHADLSKTRAWCLDWLGMGGAGAPEPTEEEKAARAAKRKAEAEARDRAEAAERAASSKKAFGLWLQAEQLRPQTYVGSLADTYYLSRGIDLASGLLAQGRPLPGALRLFRAHDYFCADGEILTFPCIAALMSGPDGRGQALHRTWIAADGKGKALLPDPKDNKARKIWGPPKGAVVRISKGAGQLSPEEAARAGRRQPLAVTEGVEDGLAVALALPGWRVWAAGTLGNIGEIPILHCIERIVVCADNDWGKAQAEAALERSLAKLRSSGVAVKVARAPRGKDMNDLLKGATI